MNGCKLVLKRIFCLFIIFSFILFGISQNRIVIEGKSRSSKRMDYKNTIQKREAKEIANFHLNVAEDHREGRRTKENKWSDDTKISKTYPLYDSEEKLCAYAFELKDSGEDAGYVVVGANEEYSPIIEYATSGKFYDGELKESEYLLYDGTLGYYKTSETSDVVSDIRDKGHTCKKVKTRQSREKHTEEWQNISEQLTMATSSNPPSSGDAITNPGAYESGYVTVNHGEARNYDLVTYFSMLDFPGYTNHCAATATTNLLLYWNERKTQKVNLMKGSWSNTLSYFVNYFTNHGGTWLWNVETGLEEYFDEIGVSTDVVSYWDIGSTDWEEMKYRLDFGEPFIYCVRNHYYYGGNQSAHAVLALGYKEYVYSTTQSATNSNYSGYLCVADGWTKLANRYININTGADYTQDDMVTLYFVGKY